MQRVNHLLDSLQNRDNGTMKMFVALALLLPAFAVASEVISWGCGATSDRLEAQAPEVQVQCDNIPTSMNMCFFFQVQLEDRDGGEMEVSEHRQCYVYGQCQVTQLVILLSFSLFYFSTAHRNS